MMVLSFIGGAWLTGKMLKRYGLNPELIWEMLPWIALGGIVGAKVYYLALHWQALLANPLELILSREGLVWYGGLMGGVLAYYLQIRSRKLPMAVMFDATAPALFLSIAIGRVGCFLVGDDYGMYTPGPLGIAFPEGIPPSTAGYLRSVGDSVPAAIADNVIVPVHPTQLYETGIALVLCCLVWRRGTRRLKPGQLFGAFLGLYAVERFLIEILRAKDDRFLIGLSTAQVISILLTVAAIVLWQLQKSKPEWDPRAAPASAASKPKPKPA